MGGVFFKNNFLENLYLVEKYYANNFLFIFAKHNEVMIELRKSERYDMIVPTHFVRISEDR